MSILAIGGRSLVQITDLMAGGGMTGPQNGIFLKVREHQGQGETRPFAHAIGLARSLA